MKTFISSKTENQKKYIRAIIENDITICSGPSGTGKSVVGLGIALEHFYRADTPYKKIYLTRPMVGSCERDFPYLKGTLLEKITPHYASIIANLTDLLGSKKELNELLDKELVVLQPIELMRGFTYKNCYVIITEAQNMTIAQCVMAITRIGENCKMIFEGDTDQKDIRGPDGLSFLRSRIGNCPDLCGCVEMTHKDIVRHPLIGKILTQLNYRGLGYDYSDIN